MAMLYAAYLTMTTHLEELKGRLSREDEGATAVEYGLIVALIAVAIIGGVTLLGGKLSSLFSNVAGKMP